MRRHDRFERILQEARDLPPLLTAIVHPCNAEAIEAAIEARDEGLITPVLVGPEHKIRAAAEQAGALDCRAPTGGHRTQPRRSRACRRTGLNR